MKISDRQREIADRFINKDREMVFFSRRDDTMAIPFSEVANLDDTRLRQMQSEIGTYVASIESRIEHVNVLLRSGREVKDSEKIRKRLKILQRFSGEIRRTLERRNGGTSLPQGLSVKMLEHESGHIIKRVKTSGCEEHWIIATKEEYGLVCIGSNPAYPTWQDAWVALKEMLNQP
jgi:hypothetical protein